MRVSVAPFVCAGLVAYGALLVVACDSDKFYPSTGGSRPFAPAPVPFDAGNTATAEVPPSPCADAEVGDPCTSFSGPTTCELGDAANYACNPLLTCTSSAWRVAEAGPPCTSTCPTTFTEDEPDGACSGGDAPSVLCEYPEGICGCARASRVGDASTDADADPDAAPGDAGADAASYVWTCIAAKHQEGCPRTRPRLGARCVKKVTCDYGSCVFDDGIAVECRGSTESFWGRAPRFDCRPPGFP